MDVRSVSYKELFKNPANILLVIIFFLSLFVGLLFVVRIFNSNNNDDEVVMNEIKDEGDIFVSKNELNVEGAKAQTLVLTLNKDNTFTLAIMGDNNYGYSGIYTENETTITLFTDYIYSSTNKKNEYKMISINKNASDYLVFNNAFNNTTNFELVKKSKDDVKESNYKNYYLIFDKKEYTYLDDDNNTINNGNYNISSSYAAIKMIDRINKGYVQSEYDYQINAVISSLYNGLTVNKYNISNYQILEFILPNLTNNEYLTSNINNFTLSVFAKNININDYTSVVYNNSLYSLVDGKYSEVNKLDKNNNNNNFVKRIYNYEIINNKLYIYEVYVGYICDNNTCKFYPINYNMTDEHLYYDFETKDSSINSVLSNLDKMKHYVWVFNIESDNNYYFESLEFVD